MAEGRSETIATFRKSFEKITIAQKTKTPRRKNARNSRLATARKTLAKIKNICERREDNASNQRQL